MDAVATREEANVRIMRRWFQEVWNQRREETIDELFAPDVKAHGIGEEPLDFEGFKASWRALLATFSDFHIEIHEAFGCGDMTACRMTVTGNHTGDGLGFVPSNKPVRFDVQCMTKIRNGQIIEGWNVIDMAAVYRQIGVLTA